MTANLSPAKQALLALKEMQKKLDALENAKHEPIAIIGMSGRFPNASNTEALWQLLKEEKNSISQKNWTNIHQQLDKSISYGGFVPHLQEFDAQFFQIAPREATTLDPQQRLLLEVTWEALESAGIASDKLNKSQTGVFIGLSGIDYWHQLLSLNNRSIDAYLTTGNTHSMASGRLSYFFGLTGISLSIDTACSSSLVAIHLAINSLRNQECEMALVGGVNRIVSPNISRHLAASGMLSKIGLCQTFSANADGFVRSEGCGMVILKRLSQAIANKDNILAVLYGSAVNQDGHTSGLTVPNSVSQMAVISSALQNSRLKSNQISFIETHGTGTSLGDYLELEALKAVFVDSHTAKNPLILGAMKTNIGHLEAASGIASLIKVILCLKYEQIPANLHFNQPNPQINWQDLPFFVPTSLQPWPKSDKPRIAGVSAFGFSGTNAHIIVAEAPDHHNLEKTQKINLPQWHLFTLSARNEKALQELVSHYADYLKLNPDLSVGDICFTVNTGRTSFKYRLAIAISSTVELQEKLAQWVMTKEVTDLWQGKVNLRIDQEIDLVISYVNFEAIETKQKLMEISHLLDQQIFNLNLLNDQQKIIQILAQLYIKGINVIWSDGNDIYQKISLPTYAFQRQKYWLE